MKRIYVAGPLSKGDLRQNVINAIKAGDAVADLGCAPFIPHLTVYWQRIGAKNGKHRDFMDYDFWLAQDFAWLAVCDALLRLPGDSKGADLEEIEAKRLGIPIFYSLEDFQVWLTSQE